MSLRRFLYTLLLYLIFPFVILKLFWRSASNPAYRQRIPERLGIVKPDSDAPVIWVHAVSVGEAIASQPLIESLIETYPNHRILVTTTTPTGSDRVKSLFSERVAHVYYPYDLPEIIYRFLKRMKPKILIVVETEIWPNLYAACHKRDIPIIIVNARLSAKSTKSYGKIKALVAETLSYVSTIAVRSKADADSFRKLGASEAAIQVSGNIKFDIELDQKQISRGKERRKQWGIKRPVLVVASTHEGEDEKLLDIYKNLLTSFPDLLLILIPRHPERFDKVYELCLERFSKEQKEQRKTSDKPINIKRHTQIHDYKSIETNIIIGDSMGEMQSWFATADVTFIGGSLVETGGHNPLEAIVQGVPVVSGPHMFNFEDIVLELDNSDLLTICHNEKQVGDKISNLLTLTQDSGTNNFQQKAQIIMQQQQGVTARLMRIISEYV